MGLVLSDFSDTMDFAEGSYLVFMRHCLIACRAAGLALLVCTFAGCGDITGESPRIAEKETSASQVNPTPAAADSQDAGTSASGSGWTNKDMAHRAFGLPLVEKSSTASESAAQAIASSITSQTASQSEASATPPALTSPDPALGDSPGLYMRQAQQANVNWRLWQKSAFEEARQRNVPMLIVIGSAWSHDSRVMDDVVFADAALASQINNAYVPVRVDSDERPDIWARYRMAYEVLNKVRAKPPLLVFAMPDGRPFDIVSSVSARGEGGLEQLLGQATDLYVKNASEVTNQAASIEKVLGELLTAPKAQTAPFEKETFAGLASSLQSDAKGNQADALRAGRVAGFLLHYGADASSDSARSAASDLLLDRFRSGQRDHIMGGYFFRIPGSGDIQFGKVLPVQSEMISAFARAYAQDGKSLLKEGVTEILRFCHDWLEAPEGGFYTCQAPDIPGGDDSGAYFTWTQKEIQQIVGDKTQATVLSTYLNADADKKTNLHVTDRLQKAADAAGVSYEAANKALEAARTKLHDARMAADKVPMIDKSMIAAWNADMICAYLQAGALTGNTAAREFALKSADMIIESMVSEKDGVARVLYKGRASGFGYLADNVKMAAALYQCYQASNQKEYLDSSRSLMNFVESRFLDKDSGLYFDTNDSGTSASEGLLKLKYLPLEDDISRAPNAVAAQVWYELYATTKDTSCKERGDRLVKAALQRRTFNNEALCTWGEAGLMGLNGPPKYKKSSK